MFCAPVNMYNTFMQGEHRICANLVKNPGMMLHPVSQCNWSDW